MASRMLEARTVAALDPGGMRDIIASLPEQLSTWMKVGEAAPVPIEESQRIFIVGMGGSAIGGGWALGALDNELKEAIAHLQALRTRLRPESGVRSNRAKALALRFRAVIPIMYAPPPFIAVARRWQTQLNENSKVLSFTSTFPEADHNELVGWMEDSRARAHRAILLRDRDEAPDIRRQLDITVRLMARKTKVEQVTD